MKKWFAAALSAKNDTGMLRWDFGVKIGAALRETEEEATSAFYAMAKNDAFPESEGWKDHKIAVIEIPAVRND